MIWTVEVGQYEKGRILEIQAPTVDAAIKLATKQLKDDEIVVQVKYVGRRKTTILWDYMNGGLWKDEKDAVKAADKAKP